MNSESVSGYIFILPFVIGFLVFTVFPMLASLVLSFTDYDMLSAPVFVGLKNYKQMFTQDPLIYKTLFNTFYFTITSVPLKLAFALMVAMLLVNTNKITSIYRAMFYLPSMVGGSVAIAVLWRRMFAGDGLVNALLGAVGLPDDVYWLGNENTAIWTLITIIDRPDTYLETSASSAFAYGILKAVREGKLSAVYEQVGLKAAQGVLDMIAPDGTVQGVSAGTPVFRTVEEYNEVEVRPMPYGQSMALLMLAELIKH